MKTPLQRIREDIARSGLTPQQFADRMNSLSKEEIAQAMEKLPTAALEWAVKFEALAHTGRKP